MLEARDLAVELDGQRVLDGVSLSVAPGELVGLVGPPGAGKSVLLKTLGTLLPFDSGELVVDGERVERGAEQTELRRRIGMAFQNDALFDSSSVLENVAFPLRRRRVPEAEALERARARLADVGLAGAASRLPSELSGGMRKRVGIARATVAEPRVGLFDDPIAGLDPLTGARILELIVTMTARLRMATLVVSNELPVLLPVCARVLMLLEGRVVYAGSPAGLRTAAHPAVRQFATGADEGPL